MSRRAMKVVNREFGVLRAEETLEVDAHRAVIASVHSAGEAFLPMAVGCLKVKQLQVPALESRVQMTLL